MIATEPDTKTASSAPKATNGEIAYAKIFPPIGIARVGNSTEVDGYFIGPEGVVPSAHLAKDFSFRDSQGALKRQAARFRIYGFTKNGELVRELTATDADITWNVQLANKKSGWFKFDGARKALQSLLGTRPLAEEDGSSALRNDHLEGTFVRVQDAPLGQHFIPDAKREKLGLEITANPVKIAGRSKLTCAKVQGEQYEFRAKFRHVLDVYLGELRTDDDGRLMVLGGHGLSGAHDENGGDVKDIRWIRHYANNLDWHDDISDGFVKAKVVLKNGQDVVVRGDAWVVVAPPDFAPDIENLVTLRDVLEESIYYTNRRQRTAELPAPAGPDNTAFRQHILPILERMLNYRWVNQLGLRGHGFNKPGDFSAMFGMLGDPDDREADKLREHIFKLIRKPVHYIPEAQDPAVPRNEAEAKKAGETEYAISQATASYMPPLSGDENDREVGKPHNWLAVTHLQYARLEAWSKGKFVHSAPEGELAAPARVTRAMMDACCGGAFYPGMELTSIVRHPGLFLEDDAFRLRSDILRPGDLTKYMACPWQADFFECRNDWWPAQRPDDVIVDEDFKEITASFQDETSGTNTKEFERLLFNRQRWDRGIDWRRPSKALLNWLVLGRAEDFADMAAYLTGQESGHVIGRVHLFARLLGLPNEEVPAFPERTRSPWRLQYLCQERLDICSTRYLLLLAPSPEEVFTKDFLDEKEWNDLCAWMHGLPLHRLRGDWTAFRVAHAENAVKIDNLYLEKIGASISTQIETLLRAHPAAGGSVAEFIKAIGSENVDDIAAEHPEDFSAASMPYRRLRVAELLAIMKDLGYSALRNTAGDMGMIEEWHTLGVVVNRPFNLRPDGGTPKKVPVQIEVDRPTFSGHTYREYFHYVMNVEKYPGFVEYSKTLARRFLAQAEEFIERLGLQDSTHPESFVPYSDTNFEAKLEQIYEIVRQQAAAATPWAEDVTREEDIRRIIGNSAFNQTDGAWLRYAANAGPADEVRGLLFKVWSDETGNGDPSKHHGNLYTTLVNQLGFFPEDIRSEAYAQSPRIQLSSYIGALVQLVISQHSEEFFPEILGMTLFLEWEVLSLVPRVKRRDYLGIDSQFWRMHVGIDNATDGHGYAAKRAVKLYLDKVLAESGYDAVQDHWRRVWRGFVAFALGGNEIYGNDAGQADEDIDARYENTPAARVAAIMLRKRPFGNLNHNGKGLSQFRINDLFDDSEIFLEELSHSKWITAGDPDNSGLIKHLTSFEGPMYKVFDDADINTWRDWISWLGNEGATPGPKHFVTKGEAMLALVTELRERAMAAHGHTRFKLATGAGSERLSIQQLFSQPDLKKLLSTLRDRNNGWVVPGRPEESPLLIDMARGDKPMGRALDERLASTGRIVGRHVIYEWIAAGCPIPGEKKTKQVAQPRKKQVRRLIVQEYGLGALH